MKSPFTIKINQMSRNIQYKTLSVWLVWDSFFSGVMSHDIRIVCPTSISKLVDMEKVSGIGVTCVCLTYPNPKVFFWWFEGLKQWRYAETVALALHSDVKLHWRDTEQRILLIAAFFLAEWILYLISCK